MNVYPVQTGNIGATQQSAGGSPGQHQVMQAALQAAAQTLGMSASDLMTAMRGGSSLSDLAQQQGVSLNDVQSAMTKAAQQAGDQAVQAGTLSQDQESALLQSVQNRIANIGQTAATQQSAGTQATHTHGHHGHHGGGKVFEATVQAAAQTLGMSSSALTSALQNGTSIGDLAQQQGVSIDAVQSAMNQAAQQQLTQDVQAGTVSQDQATQLQQQFQNAIATFLQQPTSAAATTGSVVNAAA